VKDFLASIAGGRAPAQPAGRPADGPAAAAAAVPSSAPASAPAPKRPAAQAPAAQPPKRPKPEAAGGAGPLPAPARAPAGAAGGAVLLSEPGDRNPRWAAVRQYPERTGGWWVDVREFYPDKATGEPRPTQKGLMLRPDQWAALSSHAPAVTAALAARDAGFRAELGEGSLRFAAVSDYGGRLSVALREHYRDGGGELRPGKKGINLTEAQWAALCQVSRGAGGSRRPAPAAAAAAPAAAPAEAPPAPPPASLGVPPQGMGELSAEIEARASAAPGPGRKGPAGSGQDGLPATQATQASPGVAGDWFADLGGNKRVTVSEWKGRTFVHLREYYEREGEMRPSAKGVALGAEQWAALSGAAADVSRAADLRDVTWSRELGGNKRVSLSQYKSSHYVNVREYYERGGEMLPGKKGLNLTLEQWSQLERLLPEVNERLT